MRNLFNEVSDLPNSVFTELISNVIGLGIFSLASYLVETVLVKRIPELDGKTWVIYSIFVLIILLLIFRSIKKIRASKIYGPTPEFKIIEKEFYHCYLNMDTIIHKRRFKLLALRNHVSSYRSKFHWTGEKYTIRCINKEYRAFSGPSDGVWESVEVDFGRKLKRGEIVDFTIEWKCENKERRAKHFFSINVKEPTDKLILDLHILHPLKLKEIVKSTVHIASNESLGSTTAKVSDGRYIWTIEKPPLMHRYRIDFNDIV